MPLCQLGCLDILQRPEDFIVKIVAFLKTSYVSDIFKLQPTGTKIEDVFTFLCHFHGV